MPRQSSGAYQAPNGTSAVSGASISSSAFNTLEADIGNEITNSLDRSGRGTMLANLNLGGFKGVSAADPTVATDLATKNYADTTFAPVSLVSTVSTVQTTANAALPKAGGTMTGALTLAGNPSGVLDAAPKQYVDAISAVPSPTGKANYLLTNNGTTSSWDNASVVRARASFTNGAGSPPTTGTGAVNIASIARNSTGNYTVTFTSALASVNYQVVGQAYNSGYDNGTFFVKSIDKGTSSFIISMSVATVGRVDFTSLDIVVFGGW